MISLSFVKVIISPYKQKMNIPIMKCSHSIEMAKDYNFDTNSPLVQPLLKICNPLVKNATTKDISF